MQHDHLAGAHDTWLVLLAIVIAVLASYTALDIGDRIKAVRGKARVGWLLAGAGAMGGGIWSMHFIAMLAFSLEIPHSYDTVLTLLSLLVAVLFTGLGFLIASARLNWQRLAAAGTLMGLGVAAMHYVGMAAIQMAAEIHYEPGLFLLSIVIAVVAASAALWLAFTMEQAWRKAASALIMGGAIAGMHFVGMAAAHFVPTGLATAFDTMSLSPQLLAIGIAAAAFCVSCLAVFSAAADRRLSQTVARGDSEVRQIQMRHRSLVRNSSDIIAILDRQVTIAYCSNSSERILGYAPEDLVGRSLIEFLQPEDVARFGDFRDRVELSPATNLTEEFHIRHANGDWRAFEMICNNLENDPAIDGIVVNLRDITVRKRVMDEMRGAKELAEQGSRAKSAFLAAMSHELRTPLNAVIGFSEVIKSGALGEEAGPRAVDYARHIHDSARHLLGVINDILDLSKAENGQLNLAEDFCHPAKMAADCLRLIGVQAENSQIALESRISAQLPYLRLDSRRAQKALLNVLSNAVKFTKPGGRVEIDATLDGGGLTLTVRDTGIGMTAGEIAIALEPFRQIDSRLNRRYKGAGLGLPLAKHLLELHGGTLRIESSPGVGTCVSLRFPPERVVWSVEEGSRQAAG